MIELSDEQFEECAADAFDTIPQDLLDRLDNVAILIEDEPPPEYLPPHGTLLGLYVGVPLPQRTDGWSYGSLPDRIYLFRGPLRRTSRDTEHLKEQIRVTMLHEVGHYFGLSDDRLHGLGWG